MTKATPDDVTDPLVALNSARQQAGRQNYREAYLLAEEAARGFRRIAHQPDAQAIRDEICRIIERSIRTIDPHTRLPVGREVESAADAIIEALKGKQL